MARSTRERESWRLPWSVKPFSSETRESYYRRLMGANHLQATGLGHLAARAGALFPWAEKRSKEAVLEALGGLPDGYLDRAPFSATPICIHSRCRCGEGVANDRYLCRRCASGEAISLMPNLKPYVCSKHWLWVGPATTASDQISVRGLREFGTAERRHRILVSQGRFDPVRFGAIWKLLAESLKVGEWAPQSATLKSRGLSAEVMAYPAAIALYRSLEDSRRLSTLLNPKQNRIAIERQLQYVAIDARIGEGSARVARLLRYHLRPDFYRVATATTPGWRDGKACAYPIHAIAPHDRELAQLDTSDWPSHRGGVAPGFPEFDDPSSPLYIEPDDREGYCFEFWYEYWNDPGAHKSTGPKRAGYTRVWICTAGHLVRSPTHQRRHAMTNGCRACVGKVAVPGVTDIATTHPEAFAFWDHSKNEHLPYWEQTAGRIRLADWRCPRGHEWRLGIALFVQNPHCKRCDIPNQRRVDIPAEFPALVPRWNVDANDGLDPSSVAMYDDMVAWLCPDGHPYVAPVSDVARSDFHCPICTHRRLLPGVNDFQTLYPEKAREFAVSLNGGLTADQVWPKSPKKLNFICPRGHVYTVSARERVDLNIGCTKCTGRQCIPGETDLQTLKPEVAVRWDYARNGPLTPDQVHPGSSKRAYFTCLCGKPWRTEIRYMRPDRYCKECTGAIRSGKIRL